LPLSSAHIPPILAGNNGLTSQEIIMHKLLEAMKANPTKKNALKLAKHIDKHPMTECFIKPVDWELMHKLMLDSGV
jgi:hypothetical protein